MYQWKQDYHWLCRKVFHAYGDRSRFARAIGVTTQAMDKWERGDSIPNHKHQERLAELRREHEEAGR